jgi:molybdopterin/thiamine biosynthesis adenylyltransferase/rhodanese-related sulfurtransferase
MIGKIKAFTKRPSQPVLSSEERTRYSRHLLLPQMGEEGQLRLKQASVLVVGAGGLGSPTLTYLAAAGIGRLGIVDFDRVDATNLHRQVLFTSQDVGRKKLDAARDHLAELNPLIQIELHDGRLTSENALDIISRYDLVLDGTDNFATRYLVNDACVLSGKPNVYASIYRFDGQVSVFGAPGGPCYRCVFPEPPPPGSVPSCAEGGVLGVLPGVLGTLQATEAIKYIAGLGEPLTGRLLVVDALSMTFKNLLIHRDPDCAVCGERPTIQALIDYELFCEGSISTETEFAHAKDLNTRANSMFFGPSTPSISVKELQEKKKSNEDFLLLDVRQPEEQQIADIGGTLVPMDQLADRLEDIRSYKGKDIVVMCRTGSRSAFVVDWLQKQGVERVYNLDGGIAAWSRQIDPSVALY